MVTTGTNDQSSASPASYQPTSGNFDKDYHLNAEKVNTDNREAYSRTVIGYHHPDYM